MNNYFKTFKKTCSHISIIVEVIIMHVIYNAFVYIVWFFATFYTVFLVLSLIVYKHRIFEKKRQPKKMPFVSFLVPAYNEEKTIADTIESLKKLTYKKAEFIILSDGSSDNTAAVVRASIKGDSRFVFVDNTKNKGKAAVLNQGIEMAKGELVATMDADSVIEHDIIQKTLPYFHGKDVGAVTVSVEVKDPKTLLEKVIALEYALGLSLFLKLLSFFNCIFVTPGPFSIYKKKVLKKIGGFDVTNITEDLEIAYRLHKSKYRIMNCIEAKVFTTLPSGFKRIYVQRKRWYSGAINTLLQHKDVIFNRKYRLFGFFMPFNYSLIILGLGLFLVSLYLFLSKTIEKLLFYRYTGFNFFDHFTFDFDLLNYSRVNFLGMSMFIATVSVMIFGISLVRKKYRENKMGLAAFPFMFFLYQIFWTGSILALIRRSRIKWR